MPTKTVSPGVMRFDLPERKTHGWMVRVRRQKELYQQFFSDKRYGGKRKARALAEARYEEWVASLPEKQTLTNRNKSGKVGVYRQRDVDRRWPNCEYWHCVAAWTAESGERRIIRFSCNKYGEQEAWDLACLARDKKIDDRKILMRLYAQQQARAARKAANAKNTAPKTNLKQVRAAASKTAARQNGTAKKVVTPAAGKRASRK